MQWSFTNVQERKNRAFNQLKRKGIARYNTCHAELQDAEVLHERQTLLHALLLHVVNLVVFSQRHISRGTVHKQALLK